MKTKITAFIAGALFLAPFSALAATPTPQQTIAIQNELISLLEQEIQALEAQQVVPVTVGAVATTTATTTDPYDNAAGGIIPVEAPHAIHGNVPMGI